MERGERNERAQGDAGVDRRADAGREALLAGECCFAERYFAGPGFGVREVEAFAQQSNPKWSLAATRGRMDVRLPALSAALAMIEPGLPHRMLMTPGDWRWPEVRAFALALHGPEADDAAAPDLDPSLGEML